MFGHTDTGLSVPIFNQTSQSTGDQQPLKVASLLCAQMVTHTCICTFVYPAGASGSGYEAGTGGSDVSMGAEDDDDLDEDAIWTSLREREAAAAAAAARKTPEQASARS